MRWFVVFACKVSRFRQRSFPRAIRRAAGKVSYAGNVYSGRLICDTYLTARELIRETSYSLASLAESKLGETRHNVNPADVPFCYEDSKQLFALVRESWCYYCILELCFEPVSIYVDATTRFGLLIRCGTQRKTHGSPSDLCTIWKCFH